MLRKVQVEKAAADPENISDWAMTYYVYDKFGNQVYVLQPELSKLIHQDDTYVPLNWIWTTLRFKNKYDSKQRLILKASTGSEIGYISHMIHVIASS